MSIFEAKSLGRMAPAAAVIIYGLLCFWTIAVIFPICASAWPLLERWCGGQPCSSWMSRCPTSMPSCAAICDRVVLTSSRQSSADAVLGVRPEDCRITEAAQGTLTAKSTPPN
jgi:hypothetical protein